MTDGEVRERVTRLEAQLESAQENPEVVAVVQSMLEIYGEALSRMVQGADPTHDELVSHLLILHQIEPPTLLQIAPLTRSMAS